MKALLVADARVPVGSVFGKWTVIGQPFRIRDLKRKQPQPWIVVVCRCECGAVAVQRIYALLSGPALGCMACSRRLRGIAIRAHGDSATKLYNVWTQMVQRCTRKNHPSYRYYGGRGIRVCKAWHNYPAFKAWAVRSGYREGLTIERKRNSRGYSPGNCCWVTQMRQVNNRRNNLLISAFGETKSVADWSRDPRCVVGWKCLWARWHAGRRDEAAITTPSKR